MDKIVCTECGLDIQDREYFFKLELYELVDGEPEQRDDYNHKFIHTGCFLAQENEE